MNVALAALPVVVLRALMIQRATPTHLRAAPRQAVRQLAAVVVALMAVLAVSRLMVHAGMISAVAMAVAHGTGPVWALLVPFVGVLGTFVTGSATASNILFSDFQATTAAQRSSRSRTRSRRSDSVPRRAT